MPFEPTNLRLVCALVAGAFTLSSCVTTVATSPMTVLAHAGLPPEKQADMWTQDGVVTVDGSTDVTLHVIREKTTTYELRLASLRNEGGKLLLLDTGEKIDLTDISTTEVTVSSPSRNVELILGIAGGSLLLTALIYVVAALQWSRSAGMHQ